MNKTKPRVPQFRVGELVRFRHGPRTGEAEIIEDRGPLGVGGQRIYRIRLESAYGEPDMFEVSEDHIELASFTDAELVQRRIESDRNVIQHLLGHLDEFAIGKLESPQKLVAFYAGYTAMYRLVYVKTRLLKQCTGDPELDDRGCFLRRVTDEVFHSARAESNTLLKVAVFRYWAKKVLALDIHYTEPVTP